MVRYGMVCDLRRSELKEKKVGRGQRWNSKMDFKKEMLTMLLDL